MSFAKQAAITLAVTATIIAAVVVFNVVTDRERRTEAVSVCEQIVGDRLYAALTPPESSLAETLPAPDTDARRYLVEFGATTRDDQGEPDSLTIACTLQWQSDEAWSLVSLTTD